MIIRQEEICSELLMVRESDDELRGTGTAGEIGMRHARITRSGRSFISSRLREPQDTHIAHVSYGVHWNGLLPAGNLHRFNVVGHIQLGQVRNALPRREGNLCTFEILILIGKHRGA